jgi:hypothetical protein
MRLKMGKSLVFTVKYKFMGTIVCDCLSEGQEKSGVNPPTTYY